MEITSVEQLESFELVIGEENVEAGKRLLADGGRMWVFKTLQEIEDCADLDPMERQQAKKIFSGLDWAGIFRVKPRVFPGFTIDFNIDPHGNSRGSGRGSCNHSIH